MKINENFADWQIIAIPLHISIGIISFLALSLRNYLKEKNKFIMKIGILIIIFPLLQVSASTEAQVVTIKKKEEPLQNVLKLISYQSGYDFIYADQALNKSKLVTINVKDASVVHVLEMCFKDQPLIYQVLNKTVLVKVKKEGNPIIGQLNDIDVKARVVDTDGKPISGASLTIKNTITSDEHRVISTDKNGDFIFRKISEDAVLIVSFVGYQSKEIAVSAIKNGIITLSISDEKLNEIVVVGYGMQKKINLTGSVATVKDSQFEDQPITNASQILAGKVAGVNINQTSGVAGEDNSQISIRGVGTLNNSDPLIVIDGVVVTTDNIARVDINGSSVTPKSNNPLYSLNPEDIESISVLKDAASAAIYGSRAANGVILVTTKRGRLNVKPTIKYDGYYGASKPTNLPRMINNTVEFMSLMNEANANTGKGVAFSQLVIDKYSSYGDITNTNWIGLLFPDKSAAMYNHNLSISGGNNNTNYFLSLGILSQDAVVATGNFKRYNGRVNLDSKILNNLKVGASIAFSRGEQNMPTNDLLFNSVYGALRATPLQPAYTSDGQFALKDGTTLTNPSGVQVFNPLSIGGGESIATTQSFLGTIYADWEIIKDLHLKGTLTTGINPYDESNWTSSITGYNWRYKELLEQGISINQLTANLSQASLSISHSESKRINPYIQATYSKIFDKHRFDLLIGASQESYKYNYFQSSRRGFSSNVTRILSAGDPSTQLSGGSASNNSLVSQFTRLSYNFDSKYLLETNLRRDGSSRFGSANRYGIFPSFSIGWVVSAEKFMSNIKAITLLKFRGSWGQLGNQYAISDFPSLALIGFGSNYNFNSTTVGGASQSTLGNPNLKWETTTTTDLGLDLTMFKSRFELTFDYYKKQTKDIIYNTPIPSITGFSSFISNLASVQNEGIELALNYNEKIRNFSFSIGVNGNYNKNKLLHINSELPESNDRVVNGPFVLLRGQPIDAIYGLKVIGIFQSAAEVAASPKQFANTGAGDLKYEDINGPNGTPDGIINDMDRQVIGKGSPTWTYGFNFNLSYKNLSLNTQFQGITDADAYSNFEYYVPSFIGSNIGEFWRDRWTPSNPSATLPRLWNTDGPNTQMNNSFFVQDRTYLRLKNITIAYNLKSLFKKTFISSAKVFISGQNLFTITKYDGFDPERATQLTRSGVPQIKIVIAGLSLGF